MLSIEGVPLLHKTLGGVRIQTNILAWREEICLAEFSKKKPSIILDYSSLCFVWEINKGAAIRILLFLLYERKVESKIIVKEFFQYYTTFGSEENFI